MGGGHQIIMPNKRARLIFQVEEGSTGGIILEPGACGRHDFNCADEYASYIYEFPLKSIHSTNMY